MEDTLSTKKKTMNIAVLIHTLFVPYLKTNITLDHTNKTRSTYLLPITKIVRLYVFMKTTFAS